MKTITKIWCNSSYMKNSVSGPNGDLPETKLKLILNYWVSVFMLVK